MNIVFIRMIGLLIMFGGIALLLVAYFEPLLIRKVLFSIYGLGIMFLSLDPLNHGKPLDE